MKNLVGGREITVKIPHPFDKLRAGPEILPLPLRLGSEPALSVANGVRVQNDNPVFIARGWRRSAMGNYLLI